MAAASLARYGYLAQEDGPRRSMGCGRGNMLAFLASLFIGLACMLFWRKAGEQQLAAPEEFAGVAWRQATATPSRGASAALLRARPRIAHRNSGAASVAAAVPRSMYVYSGMAEQATLDPAYNEVDEAAMLAAASFPIGPEELIKRAKDVLRNGIANSAGDLADDFQFIGPVVGPLKKEPFVKAVKGFDLACAFPDMKTNYHGFRVDPFEPNRVWFVSRTTGTHTGTLAGSIKPTGKEVVCPPQAQSILFDKNGKVTKITVGVVMDRTVGNTGGLGGVFGLFSAVGAPLPFPEARPWKMSKRYKFFQFLGQVLSGMRTTAGTKEAS